jgi:outer membrane protein assembly factor BamB
MSFAGAMEMKQHQHARRVRSFLTVLVAVSIALGISPEVAAAAPGDWPQLGYGPAHNGYQRDETVLDRTTVRRLARAFTSPFRYAGIPVVVGNTIYVTKAVTNELIKMSASDGSVLWRREVDGPVAGFAPAVGNDIVYVTTQWQPGWDGGSLYAFEASTGDLLWRIDGTASTPPVIADGKVFVGGGAEGGPASVAAYDAASGAVLWTTQTGIYEHPAAPAVSRGRVFVARSDSVYALDETTGALLWHRYVPGELSKTPVIASGMVLVGGWLGIRAIDAETGDARWAYPGTPYHFLQGMPAVAHGTVYAHVDGQLVALRLANGAVKWKRTIQSDPVVLVDAPPAVANGVVYVMGVVTGSQRLLAYGTGGYRKRMLAARGTHAIISNGSVYVAGGTSGDSLTVLRLPGTAT